MKHTIQFASRGKIQLLKEYQPSILSSGNYHRWYNRNFFLLSNHSVLQLSSDGWNSLFLSFFTLFLIGDLSMESRWHQVYPTLSNLKSILLLSNLNFLNNIFICIVSIVYLSCLSKLLRTIPSEPAINHITDTVMFYSIFSCLERSKYLSIFFTFFDFL